MRAQCRFAALFAAVALASVAQAQSTHEVQLLNTNQFDPSELSINAGDTVRWVWTGGLHNVVSGEGPPGAPGDGDHFDSGLPSGRVGATFEVTFLEAGVYPYYSELSFFVGMRGAITVTGSLPDPDPEGSGETNPACDALAMAVESLDAFRAATGMHDDLDGDTIPDEFQLALIEYAACDPGFDSAAMRDATRMAFTQNLDAILQAVDQSKGGDVNLSLGEFPELFGALTTISAVMQIAVDQVTIESLPNNLEVVTIADAPIPQNAFSGEGDLDGDGTSNRSEFQLAVNQFGNPRTSEFVSFAVSPTSPDGGNNGAPLSCGAGGAQNVQGDGALLILLLAAMSILHRRKLRSTP